MGRIIQSSRKETLNRGSSGNRSWEVLERGCVVHPCVWGPLALAKEVKVSVLKGEKLTVPWKGKMQTQALFPVWAGGLGSQFPDGRGYLSGQTRESSSLLFLQQILKLEACFCFNIKYSLEINHQEEKEAKRYYSSLRPICFAFVFRGCLGSSNQLLLLTWKLWVNFWLSKS